MSIFDLNLCEQRLGFAGREWYQDSMLGRMSQLPPSVVGPPCCGKRGFDPFQSAIFVPIRCDSGTSLFELVMTSRYCVHNLNV